MFCFLQSPHERVQCPEVRLFSSRRATGESAPFTLAKGKMFPLRNWFCFDSHWMISIYLSLGAGLAPLWASPLLWGEGCSLVWPADRKVSHGARAWDAFNRRTSRTLLWFLFTALELKTFSSPDTLFPTSFTCLAFFFFSVAIAKTYLNFCTNAHSLVFFSVWQRQWPGREGRPLSCPHCAHSRQRRERRGLPHTLRGGVPASCRQHVSSAQTGCSHTQWHFLWWERNLSFVRPTFKK